MYAYCFRCFVEAALTIEEIFFLNSAYSSLTFRALPYSRFISAFLASISAILACRESISSTHLRGGVHSRAMGRSSERFARYQAGSGPLERSISFRTSFVPGIGAISLSRWAHRISLPYQHSLRYSRSQQVVSDIVLA